MKFRKLRIAWSVFWGVAALLLIVLCVRSYGTWDRLFWTSKSHGRQLNSMLGHLTLVVAERPKQPVPFYVARTPIDDARFDGNVFGFYFEHSPTVLRMGISLWFILLAALATATAPWWRFRFSLRTLLIATTLIAVVLGLVAVVLR